MNQALRVVICRMGFVCLLHAGVTVTFSADIAVSDAQNLIFLNGKIDSDTPLQIERALAAVTKRGHDQNRIARLERVFPFVKGKLREDITLYLDSGGGDVAAAMTAGTIIRSYEVKTWVNSDATCASACTVLFVGGVQRSALGRFGIHRPYTISYSTSMAESDQAYRGVNESMDRYFRAMNITPRLLDDMNAVPPGAVRWLTETELKDLNIDGSDPAWQDQQDSILAMIRGISKQEYYERQQHAADKD